MNPRPVEWLRWRIADLLDRSRRMCWAELASWALYAPAAGRPWWRPWNNQAEQCRTHPDSIRQGGCYCGKFRLGVTPEETT